jgi:MFS family permease
MTAPSPARHQSRPSADSVPHRSPRYRWFVVAVFFVFMLLHQADKLLIGPLTTPIMEEFGIDEAQMGAVFTGALLLGAFAYLGWGYLYDRFARPKLLALAALLWGSTTWLSAIAPTFSAFLVTRASTGIDDSSYPGLHSLISDYFEPRVRGKIYGLLQVAMPVGYLLGMILGLTLGEQIGWRGVFYITGSLGVVLAAVIFFGVREVPRGRSEPELAGLEEIRTYRFSWQAARGLFRRRSLLFLYAQGFFGVFPWNVITYWFFRYLETERGYDSDTVLLTMMVAVLVLAAGYYLGGALGDWLFR